MVQMKAFITSSQVTVAAAAGALASYFFGKWIDNFSVIGASILILGYTFVIFILLYIFYRR